MDNSLMLVLIFLLMFCCCVACAFMCLLTLKCNIKLYTEYAKNEFSKLRHRTEASDGEGK